MKRRIHGGEFDIRAQRAVCLGGARARIEESSEQVDLATGREPLVDPRDRSQGAEPGDVLDGLRVLDACRPAVPRRNAMPTTTSTPKAAARSVLRSVRGHTDDVGGSAGSTTVSRFVALPDENDSNVAYVERRLASRPSRPCSSASWSAVRSADRRPGRPRVPGLSR